MINVKVSSITYVKNGVEYIEKCLRSVMNQTLQEIEIIVVDGGSNDGTKEILDNLAREDSRISVVEHIGSVGGQFNIALRMSRGEYIAICEADDYILTNKYEVQYRRAIAENVDIICGCYYNFFNTSKKEYRYRVETGIDGKTYNCLLQNDDRNSLMHPVNGFWNGLYKRSFLISNHIYMNETSGAAYQDVTFSFLSQVYAKRILFLSEEYHCYRIDNPYASMNSNKCIEMLMLEYELLRQKLINRGLWDKYNNIFLAWEICSYKHFLEFINCNNKKEIAMSIYHLLEEQRIEKTNNSYILSQKFAKVVSCFWSGEESFIRAMLDHESQNAKLLSFFSGKFINKEAVILFGIGRIGTKIYDFLLETGKKVFIVDNDTNLQSNGYQGEKIYCPENIVNKNQYPIIIANNVCLNEIYQQLVKLGVSDDRLFMCDDEELFLRKIFVGLGDKYGYK